MSTLTGQSLLQPLQARQRSSASLTASFCQPSSIGLALQHLEQQAGAAARRVLLLARRHVARAHRRRRLCRRHSPTPTQRSVARGRSCRRRPGYSKVRRRARRLVVGAEPQVLGRADRGRRPCPGSSCRPGSQIALNSRKALHQLGPEHLRQQLAARLPVAVLARERAAVAARRGRPPRR